MNTKHLAVRLLTVMRSAAITAPPVVFMTLFGCSPRTQPRPEPSPAHDAAATAPMDELDSLLAGALGIYSHDGLQNARAELWEARSFAVAKAEAIAGDTVAFLSRVQPYGQLDLLVLKSVSPEQTDKLRNFFLGMVGHAARIHPGPLTNEWHASTIDREDTLVRRLPEIRRLVKQFETLGDVEVVALWPGTGYRAGLVTYDGDRWRLDTPSPLMGFVPWHRAVLADSGKRAFGRLGTDRSEIESLVAAMRGVGIVVIARNAPSGVRAVLQGAIGDNEAGLLFLEHGSRPPLFHEFAGDGRQYVRLRQTTAPDVYFYVTS